MKVRKPYNTILKYVLVGKWLFFSSGLMYAYMLDFLRGKKMAEEKI